MTEEKGDKRMDMMDLIEGRSEGGVFDARIGPRLNSTALKKSNTPPKAETIELDKGPSLSEDISKAAESLEYLLSFTPQYKKTLKAVRDLIATDIEVTDKQQKFYMDVEGFPRDIVQRVLKMREEEVKE